MNVENTIQKTSAPVVRLRAIARASWGIGIFISLSGWASLLPPPPSLQEKGRQAPVIATAAVGDIRYYEWPGPFRANWYPISETPREGYQAFVNLRDVNVLYEEYAGVPAHKKELRKWPPLWVRQDVCFEENKGKKVEHPKGVRSIFFIANPHPTVQGKRIDSACRFTTEAIDKLPLVRHLIQAKKQKSP